MQVSEPVVIERRSGHCWLRINRPDQANALTLAAMRQLKVALAQAQVAADKHRRAGWKASAIIG